MVDDILRTLKGYDLRELVGKGGFGEVYRAYQPDIDREVAIKIILPEYANQPEFIRSFESEAHIIARLEHPHIIPLYDYWRDPDGAYLVMRFVRGGSLSNKIAKELLQLEEIEHLLDHLTSALAIAHRNNVIHCDLKPDNVLLDSDGNAYLTDFGIARVAGREPTTENVSGSLPYVSPEQLKSEAPVPQMDIYSLGVMIYEMLSGEHPYKGNTASQMIMRHIVEPLPDILSVRPDLPPLINAVIQKATAKETSQRYADVRQVWRDFQQALHQQAPIEIEDDFDESSLTNPYKGLRAFEEADATDFYGRETLVQHLTSRLKDERFLAVVGPSGSGKSSVVKAGLIPAIRHGDLEEAENWFIVTMVPGAKPLEALTEALLSIASNAPGKLLEQLQSDSRALDWVMSNLVSHELLLVIDQFEEVFTLVYSEAERLHFLNLLQTAVTADNSRLRVVVTLRADFMDKPLQYPEFGDLLRKHVEFVLPMNATELESAITNPAYRLGLRVDSNLIAAIVADVQDEPGALPLLQYALTEVYEHREGRFLTLASYQDSGGVTGALARRAEEVYLSLTPAQQAITRQMFLRLVTPGEGTEDTRRRVRRMELAELNSDSENRSKGQENPITAILNEFGKYRLLTFDREPDTRESTVEVAHEALIRTWGRLRAWLDDSREDIRLQRFLANASADWENIGRDHTYLLQGTRLAQYEEWQSISAIALTPQEQDYVSASIAERQALLKRDEARKAHEAELERRSRNRLRYLAAALAVGVIAALGLSVFAFGESQRAETALVTATNALGQAEERGTEVAQQAATSDANADLAQENANTATLAQGEALDQAATSDANAATSIAAQSTAVRSAAIARSQAFAANAIQLFQEGDTDLAILQAIEANQIDTPSIQARQSLYISAYNAAARYIVSLASVLNRTTRDVIGSRPANILLTSDGRKAITFFNQETLILNAHTGELLAHFDLNDNQAQTSGLGNTSSYTVDTILLHPDENSVFLSTSIMSLDSNVFNSISGLNPLQGATLDASSQPVIQISLIDGHEINRFERNTGTGLNQPMLVTADGKRLFLATSVETDGEYQGIVIEWDVPSGKQVASISTDISFIVKMALDASRNVLIVTGLSNDGYGLELINTKSHEIMTYLPREGGAIALSHDSQTLAILNGQGLKLWNPLTGETIGNIDVPLQSWTSLTTFQFSPDDQYLVIGAQSGRITIWNVLTRQMSTVLDGHLGSQIRGVAFSKNGQQLLTTADDQSLRIWDIYPSGAIASFMIKGVAQTNNPGFISFSEDRQIISYDISAGMLSLVNVASGELLDEIGVSEDYGRVVNASSDGKQLIITIGDNQVAVYDLLNQVEIRRIATSGSPSDYALSHDGRLLLLPQFGALKLFDVETGEQLQQHISGIEENLEFVPYVASISPDNSQALVGATNGKLRVFKLEDLSLEGSFEGSFASWLSAVSYSPNGKLALTGSQEGELTLWDAITGEPLYSFPPHRGSITQIAFSPDGNSAISVANITGDSSSRYEVRLWRILYQDNILSWIYANRAVREFTCEERELYEIEPTCSRTGYFQTRTPIAPPAITPLTYSVYTATPALPTWTATPTFTTTPTPSLSPLMGPVYGSRFNQDKTRIVTNSEDAAVRLWDVASGELIKAYPGYYSYAASWSPDATRFLTRNIPDIVQVWDGTSGNLISTLQGHTAIINRAIWDETGKRIATASEDHSVRIWDSTTGQQLLELPYITEVAGVEWSPDFSQIVTYDEDNFIIVYDATTGAEVLVIDGNQFFSIDSVTWSPDGQHFLVTTFGDTLILNALTGELEFTLSGHPFVILPNWSKDGKSIVTTSYSAGTTIVWDALTGERRFILKGKAQQPCLAQFSPDDSMIYTCNDTILSVWNATDGTHIQDFENIATIYAAYWSSDSEWIASTNEAGVVQIWDLKTGSEIQRLGSPNNVEALMSPTPMNTASPTPPPFTATPEATLSAIIPDQQRRVFGPAPGQLNIASGELASVSTGVNLADFVSELRVDVPYELDSGYGWSIVFWFRANYLVIVHASANDLSWTVYYSEGSVQEVLQSGTLDNLNLLAGRFNDFRLVVAGNTGQFLINDKWVGDFPVSGSANDIALASNIYGDGKPDTSLKFTDFTIYAIETEAILTPTFTPEAVMRAVIGDNRGSFAVGGSNQWSYEGKAGEKLSLLARADAPADGTDLNSRTGLLDSELIVYAPDGSILGFGNDIIVGQQTNAQISDLLLPQDGTYIFEVFGWQRTTGGSYTLVLNLSEE